jgi:hypothetical protein
MLRPVEWRYDDRARRLFVGMARDLAYNDDVRREHTFGVDVFFLIRGTFDADEVISRRSLSRRRHPPSESAIAARLAWRPAR